MIIWKDNSTESDQFSQTVVGGVDNEVPQLHTTQSAPLDYNNLRGGCSIGDLWPKLGSLPKKYKTRFNRPPPTETKVPNQPYQNLRLHKISIRDLNVICSRGGLREKEAFVSFLKTFQNCNFFPTSLPYALTTVSEPV